MKLVLKPTQLATLIAVAVFLATNANPLRAQSAPGSNADSKPDASKADPVLAKQIADMQAKAARLQGTLAQNASPAPKKPPIAPIPTASPMTGMSPGMTPGNSMGMDMMDKGKAGGEMMMMMPDMMKMMGMTNMPAPSPAMTPMPASMPPSALPGFPGVSHLYHIGVTGFFLDHAQHIKLSADQQTALSKMKASALTAKANSDRQIEQAEQELGTLTSSDQPDAAKIEMKVREIEKLRADQRLSFIRAVGEAAKLLTDDQRKILIGTMQPVAAPTPSATMSPMEHM